jgi:predicted small lipoprotein YifL
MKKTRAMMGIMAVLIIVSVALMACGGSSPSNTPPADSSKTVTLSDDGQTITLRVGESFLLKLGEDYNWTATVDDQTIVSRAKNIAVIRGAQGVYDALRVGKTNLTAVGDPPCRQANPPCEQPSRVFKIQIVVQ